MIKQTIGSDFRRGEEVDVVQKIKPESEDEISNNDTDNRLLMSGGKTKAEKKMAASTSELNMTRTEKWDEMYNRLLIFRNQHGHCFVPNRYDKDPQLGTWVSTQRRHYKLKNSGNSKTPLTSKRENQLKEIGFEWSAENPRTVPWDTRFMQLLDFVAKNGHAQVPIKWKENPKLSNWVSTQRQEYISLMNDRASRLTKEQIKLLDSVGFVWKAQRGGTRRLYDGGIVAPSDDAVEAESSPNFKAVANNLLKAMRGRRENLELTEQNVDITAERDKNDHGIGTVAGYEIKEPMVESSAASRLAAMADTAAQNRLKHSLGQSVTPSATESSNVSITTNHLHEYALSQRADTMAALGMNMSRLGAYPHSSASALSSLLNNTRGMDNLGGLANRPFLGGANNLNEIIMNQQMSGYAYSQQLLQQSMSYNQQHQQPFSISSLLSSGMNATPLEAALLSNVSSREMALARFGGLPAYSASSENNASLMSYLQQAAASNSSSIEKSSQDELCARLLSKKRSMSPQENISWNSDEHHRPNKQQRKN